MLLFLLLWRVPLNTNDIFDLMCCLRVNISFILSIIQLLGHFQPLPRLGCSRNHWVYHTKLDVVTPNWWDFPTFWPGSDICQTERFHWPNVFSHRWKSEYFSTTTGIFSFNILWKLNEISGVNEALKDFTPQGLYKRYKKTLLWLCAVVGEFGSEGKAAHSDVEKRRLARRSLLLLHILELRNRKCFLSWSVMQTLPKTVKCSGLTWCPFHYPKVVRNQRFWVLNFVRNNSASQKNWMLQFSFSF